MIFYFLFSYERECVLIEFDITTYVYTFRGWVEYFVSFAKVGVTQKIPGIDQGSNLDVCWLIFAKLVRQPKIRRCSNLGLFLKNLKNGVSLFSKGVGVRLIKYTAVSTLSPQYLSGISA